jgi:hypothetical protein
MNALAHSYFFWIFLIFGLLGLYILPSVIAAIRGVEGLGWIIVINLLPTGVGWLAALIAALLLPAENQRLRCISYLPLPVTRACNVDSDRRTEPMARHSANVEPSTSRPVTSSGQAGQSRLALRPRWPGRNPCWWSRRSPFTPFAR